MIHVHPQNVQIRWNRVQTATGKKSGFFFSVFHNNFFFILFFPLFPAKTFFKNFFFFFLKRRNSYFFVSVLHIKKFSWISDQMKPCLQTAAKCFFYKERSNINLMTNWQRAKINSEFIVVVCKRFFFFVPLHFTTLKFVPFLKGVWWYFNSVWICFACVQ